MGIKYFYDYISTTFPGSVKKYNSKTPDLLFYVDVLAFDLNGIIHTVIRDFFNKPKSLLIPKEDQKPVSNVFLYKRILQDIEFKVSVLKPRKKILIMIDGVSGMGKMVQQRQRRYKSSSVNDMPFDPNSISPGTLFLHNFSKYIDWYIRSNLNNPQSSFYGLEVVFSSEKVPGEGEHKIMNYLKKHYLNKGNDKICVYANDADLFLLCLASRVKNLSIFRHFYNNYEIVDVDILFRSILELMDWGDGFNPEFARKDFVLLSFFLGNDFLPTLPDIDIPSGSMVQLINAYVGNREHLVTKDRIKYESIGKILEVINSLDMNFFKERITQGDNLKDETLEQCFEKITLTDKPDIVLDLEKYKNLYYSNKLGMTRDQALKSVTKSYLQGIYWVFNYYFYGMTDWEWYYPYQYSPFPSEIIEYLNDNQVLTFKFSENKPIDQFLQLLYVLPPKSKDLLPVPLKDIMLDKKLYPDYEVKYDMDGKRKEWEGIIILPDIDVKSVKDKYQRNINKVSEKDASRNKTYKNSVYKIGEYEYLFNSYYGNIKSIVDVHISE